MLAEPPTVLCCGNDEMALRVYGMLRSRGLRVAEDISVAGYDDHRAIAETLYPPLTSAELPYVQMGTQAAALLLELIERGQAAAAIRAKCGALWCGAIRLRSRRNRMGLYFIFNKNPFPTRHSKQKTIRSFT